jgi:hypothetical protein
MVRKLPKCLESINILPNIPITIVMLNGFKEEKPGPRALTAELQAPIADPQAPSIPDGEEKCCDVIGGIPIIIKGCLVAEIEERHHHDDPVFITPQKVDVDVDVKTELEPEFLIVNAHEIEHAGHIKRGLVAVNLNLIQLIKLDCD